MVTEPLFEHASEVNKEGWLPTNPEHDITSLVLKILHALDHPYVRIVIYSILAVPSRFGYFKNTARG